MDNKIKPPHADKFMSMCTPRPEFQCWKVLRSWCQGLIYFVQSLGGLRSQRTTLKSGVRGSARVAKGLILLSIYCLATLDRWSRVGQHVM